MTAPRVIQTPLDCALADELRQAVAVMGNMDGVHKGHQILIAEARKLADHLGRPLAAIIFEPHPRQVFDPTGDPFFLTSRDQKIALLGEQGIETVYTLPFNRRLSMLSPRDFVEDILLRVIGLAGVVVGEGFQFGRRRVGTTQVLAEIGEAAGLNVKIVSPASLPGAEEKFSSTQARQALRNGDPQLAARILGRPWTVCGMVEKGKQLGRTLDFPTANIRLGDYVHPAKGVYAVSVDLAGATHKGVANFGSRPTVAGDSVLLEVYLFDFDRDIYGEALAVSFHEFIRAEQKFPDLDALKAQIATDSDKARALLAAL